MTHPEELAQMLDLIPRCDDWTLTAALVDIRAADMDRLKPEAADALQTLRARIIAEMGERTARAYIEAQQASIH